MSSASSNGNDDVMKSILDSMTLCFNPVDAASRFSNRCSGKSTATKSDKGGNTGDKCSRKPSGGSSSSSSSRSRHSQEEAAAAKAQSDPYIHRKLEIFRTNSHDIAEMGIDPRPPKKQGKAQKRNRSSNTLVDSQGSDEIAQLTRQQRKDAAAKAQGEGGGAAADKKDKSLISNLTRMLLDPFNGCVTDVQKLQHVGLCFATPVRATSAEDIHNLSDWRLTAEEFAARQEGRQMMGISGKLLSSCVNIPDVDESSCSHNCEEEDEEETITSAAYFDHKISHLVEKNPPMPLFDGQRIEVTEFQKEELFLLVKKREQHKGMGESKPSTPPREKASASTPSSSRRKSTSSSPSKEKSKSSKFTGRRKKRQFDTAPIGKSSSVSTTPSSGDANDVSIGTDYQSSSRGMRQPDIVISAI